MTTANNPSTTTSNSALFSSDSSPVVANLADAAMLAALQPDKVSVTVSASFKETNTNSQVGLKFATTSSTMVNTDLGENLKDINLITTIRSRNLHFSAYHLKPLTKLYAFFDNVNVDAYISTAYKVILTTPVHSNYSKSFLTVGSNVEVLFARDTTIYINHSKLNNGTDIEYLKATDKFIWDSITYTIKEITQPTQLEVDSNGYVAGNFLIPNTSSTSFNTGMRSFLLCDSPTNIGTEISTAAEFQYYAAGMAQTKQATTLSTMYNLVSVDPIIRSKTTESSTKTASTTSVSPGEPLVLLIDKIAPTITAYSPAKGSTGIAVNRVINLTFSEPIQKGSGDITIVKSNGTILGTFNVATSPLISLTNGETTLQITPPNLSFLSLLTVNLPAGCVKDKVGNDYVGSYDYTFTTTYDDSLPLVPISFFPSDGSVNVDVRKVIEVVFNENIAKGTGNIILRKGSAASPAIETYAPNSTNLSIINSTLYITPTNALDYKSQYFLVFEAASVKMATAPTTWGGTSIYDFSTEVAVVTVNNTFNTINNPIIDNTPGVVVVPASGNTPLGGGVMNVIDYDLDFTTATGECGIDIVSSLVADLTHQAPDAYQLFWDNNMVAGSGGSTDRPAFITTGDIPGPIKDKFGKKIGNGTFVKVDHIPSATNPIKYRFNKTKSLPNTAKLRVYTFGNAGWKQIMPPGVAVTTGAARFAITPLDSTFVPPKINGITGWEHWTGPTWVNDTTHPLDSNLPHHNNWEYKGTNGNTRWAEYGRGFVSFPAGNVSKTFTISNTGTASGSVDSISVNRSPDLLKAPALSLGEFNGVTTSISNVKKLSGSTYTDATFPISLANGESLKFNVDITWPWIYYSPEFDWNAQGVATPVTVKKILALKNSVAIRADYKKKVIDKINKLRDYILRWEVVPLYTNASVIPNSANIAMNSKSTAIVQHDPLAQSFFVNDSEYPDGYFVSSIDLFFSKKSSSDDITVQIRPLVNNQFPSATEIVPFAISTLPASSVNITDYPDNTNPLSYTKFKFDSPIYLSAGSYAIVVISTSKDYNLYTSTVGRFKINNKELRISEPPYSGDLFKSSNQQTWLPSPFQDLCFVINRCDFDTSGTLFFKSEKPENNYSSQYNKFIAETHYNQDDYIRVEISPNTDNVYQVIKNGTSGTLAPTNATGDDFINGTLTLKHLMVATRWEDVVVPYDVYFAQGENVVLNNSEALHFFKGTKESGLIDTDFSQIMLGSNYEMESRKVLDSNVKDLYAKIELSTADSKISPIIDITRLSNVLVQNIVNNETIAPDFIANTAVKEGAYIKVLIGNSYKMYLVIRAGKTAASAPLFDTGDSLNGDALLRYLGSTHNGDTELLPYGGLASSKYITRKVILASGFESTDISVIFNANTPAGSTVKVYYKAANINGSTSLEQTPYHEMVLSERKSDYMTQYVEHKYICDYNISVASSRRALPNGERFNQFAIKIVMLSSNTLVVPKIRDLRAMALDD